VPFLLGGVQHRHNTLCNVGHERTHQIKGNDQIRHAGSYPTAGPRNGGSQGLTSQNPETGGVRRVTEGSQAESGTPANAESSR
jgi:hypothetical protein